MTDGVDPRIAVVEKVIYEKCGGGTVLQYWRWSVAKEIVAALDAMPPANPNDPTDAMGLDTTP